jgi:hypothetical protein
MLIPLKRKYLNFEFTDLVFNRYYDIYIGDKDICRKIINRKYPGDSSQLFNKDGVSAVFHFDGGSDISVIWISFLEDDIIAHECLHATSSVLQEAGLKHTEETEEVYAYYLGFLVRKINENIEKRNKKCKKK